MTYPCCSHHRNAHVRWPVSQKPAMWRIRCVACMEEALVAYMALPWWQRAFTRLLMPRHVSHEYVFPPPVDSVVHAVPPGDEALTPCCGRFMFDLPRTDRATTDQRLVTCKGKVGARA